MKKTVLFSVVAMLGVASAAQAQTFMAPAYLEYPSGVYTSMAPSSVTVSYDNQPIELVDPHTNDWDEEVVTAYVELQEGDRMEVSAGVLCSLGNPSDPDDEDFWALDFALYELDLWDYTGSGLKLIIPEGIVKNGEGALNPEQEIEFHILPTFTDYTLTPDPGATLDGSGPTITVSFGGNPVKYLQSEVNAYIYDPEYKKISLTPGDGLTVSDCEVIVDLSALEDGEYEVVIPEGLVMVEAEGSSYLSPDIWTEYTLERGDENAVEAVVSESAPEAVYTLQGVKTGRTDARGIYVVGGRKIIVTGK